MASKSQQRKEKHKKKRQEKKVLLRKRNEAFQKRATMPMPEIPSGSHARDQQRFAAQTPQAWPGETPEDVAIFDDVALASLPSDMATQATAVRQALELACGSRGDEAIQCVASIPRSSPFSEWRLFLRGLVAWLIEDTSTASETWRRLNPERRPGRIATAMMNSLLPHLDQEKVVAARAPSDDGASTDWTSRMDGALLYHAKLLRRARFDRSAIRLAESGLRIPEEIDDLVIGPRKLHWLQRFVSEYRSGEPELAAALQRIALRRAFAQPFPDLFEEAVQAFEGPSHDRRNLLLSHFYFNQFEKNLAGDRAERCLEKYLTEDLPTNEAISEPLSGAMTSLLHLAEANNLMQPSDGDWYSYLFDEGGDNKDIRKHLMASVKAYPANRLAHKKYVEWLEGKLDNDRLTQKTRQPLVDELAKVMELWSKGLPEDIQPRLWLIDYLLENEWTERAKPHVDRLAGSRQDDPRVRATPWKWQLLESMRLCRRKAWFSEAERGLAEAEKLWPAWLSKKWLPYLKAAMHLRLGNLKEFNDSRETLWQTSATGRGSLTDACMMLGAAQWMRVPANDLKPLRAPVDDAVKNLGNVSESDLLQVCSFFWDLHRIQLLYPSHRMHGKKITQELFARVKRDPSRVLDHLDHAEIQTAVLMFSEDRCFEQNGHWALPRWLSVPAFHQHPMCAAAILTGVLKLRYNVEVQDAIDAVALLRAASPSERDPFYRYVFVALANEFDEKLANQESKFNPFGFDMSRGIFASGNDEDDESGDDEDDYDLDVDKEDE